MQQADKKAGTKRIVNAAAIAALWLAGTAGGWAADGAAKAWTLKTDDTLLELTVRGNKPFITVLKNPAQGWNWTPTPSEVPLVNRVVLDQTPRELTWTYQGATVESLSNSTVLTLRFTCAEPALELQSVWRARSGVGPVEHQMSVKNTASAPVSFNGEDLVAADLKLVADQAAHVFPVAAGTLGHGENLPLPYQMLQVGKTHGVYLAYDYGCGSFATTVTNNQIASRWWAAGIKNTATATGETFRCPGMMIQTYQGDEDDGANHFRRWFWNYETTARLRNNPDEPVIDIGTDPYKDTDVNYLINEINTQDLADLGIGMFHTDAWFWGIQHARSDELAAACHANGLGLVLYWNGEISEAQLKAEYDKSHFDTYRTDQYTAPPPFMPNDYRSFMNFNKKMDNLMAYARKDATGASTLRYENCCNGGNIRSIDVFRRMVVMTHSDLEGLGAYFSHIYSWSYMINPIQVRSDNVPLSQGTLLGAAIVWPPTYWGANKPGGTREAVEKICRLYNQKQRPILRGANVYHILPWPVSRAWFGIEYFNPGINRGSVLLWQNGGSATQTIKLKGLSRDAAYTLTFEEAAQKNRAMTGAQLMDEGIEVAMGSNASEIVWINWAELSASPADLSFSAADRGDKPPAKRVTLAYRGGPGTNKAFSVTCAAPWVKIEPVSGAGDGQTFSVSVIPGDRFPASSQTRIVVSRPDIVERLELPVRLRLGKPNPSAMKQTSNTP